MPERCFVRVAIFSILLGCFASARADAQDSEAEYIRQHYVKYEHRIPMRDGITLFTSVYVPIDKTETYPIILFRTPYSVSPYGADQYPNTLGPNMEYAREGYIFVYQDVRGRFMSEGTFVNMTPHIDGKKGKTEVDESSDTYDTIDWLLANIEGHNGNVGQWGISYPGFYAAAGMIDSHPALKAVSPQAPIADWFWDDFHHHGALFLPHAFNFLSVFGKARDGLTTDWPSRFQHPTPDGYKFFLELGPLSNANTLYFKNEIDFWNQIIEHPNYDEFWQKRNLLPHLKNIKCAVMTVGGWYDAEDLYGPLQIYRSAEKNNPGIFNMLVMGPWPHGGWNRTEGESLGNVKFGYKTSEFYRKNIELPFFNYHLKGKGDLDLPEAFVFETGANRWRRFDEWPPSHMETKKLYARDDETLSFQSPSDIEDVYDEYVSDPDKPVPFTMDISTGMTRPYMTDDQRFAAQRPDVQIYQTDVLEEDVTLVGPIMANLWVSTSGSASDWIVKLIDVHPDDTPESASASGEYKMGGYQMMVRSEVIRGRFRSSYEHPEPFDPNKITHVDLDLQDILHNFKRGHRIMVSTLR